MLRTALAVLIAFAACGAAVAGQTPAEAARAENPDAAPDGTPPPEGRYSRACGSEERQMVCTFAVGGVDDGSASAGWSVSDRDGSRSPACAGTAVLRLRPVTVAGDVYPRSLSGPLGEAAGSVRVRLVSMGPGYVWVQADAPLCPEAGGSTGLYALEGDL